MSYKMSKEDIEKLFKDHRCPKCGKHTLMFYYPNLDNKQEVGQEVECEAGLCGFYLHYKYNIDEIKVIRYD